MKLAEALMERASLQTRLQQQRKRLTQNALVQEGNKPAEDPRALLAELEQMSDALEDLIQCINRTNSATMLDEGTTLTDALARRDVLAMREHAYRELANAAMASAMRMTRTELRTVPTVDVQSMRKQADAYAQAYRELDTRIQSANWQTDLVA